MRASKTLIRKQVENTLFTSAFLSLCCLRSDRKCLKMQSVYFSMQSQKRDQQTGMASSHMLLINILSTRSSFFLYSETKKEQLVILFWHLSMPLIWLCGNFVLHQKT